ncbi:MAG: (Fe-S)-binding protein [bacterium]
MTLPNEDFYVDYIFSCNRCKSCTQSAPPHLLPACPPFEMMGFFGYCGGGKAHIAQAIVEGKAGNLEELAEYYRMCSMCMACKEMCPIGLDHYYLIWDVRRHLFKNGVVHPEHAKLLASVAKNNNPWSLPREERGEWLLSLGVKDARKEPVDNLYFAGCASGYRQLAGASAEAAVSLLRKAGIEVGCLGSDETCCGVFACELGDMKLFKIMARENAARFKELGVKSVIVSDPHCYACFTNNYPEVVDDMPLVEHLFEVLAPLVESGKLKPVRRLEAKVAYHDPCRLSRHTEAGGAPRKLLEAVLEEELIEMPRNRESTYCCGNGPGVKEAHPEMVSFASGNRLNEAKEAGAEKLITACPFCLESLGGAEKENGGPKCADLVRVLDDCF